MNKERVERLMSAGKMTPAGQAIIDVAKADGSWTTLDAIENLEIPPDLAQELDRYASAARNFENFLRSVKKSILEWIAHAKRFETREKRIKETARLAEKNERANQWKAKR